MAESAGGTATPTPQAKNRPMLNPNDYVSVYPDVPKGHPSNAAIGSGPWTDHFDNWQHTPEIQNLADTMDTMHGNLENTRQRVLSTQAMLAGQPGHTAQGQVAQAAHQQLGQLHDDIQAKQAALKSGSDAIRNFQPQFQGAHNEIEAQWGQWWQNRADLNACKANEVNMTQAARQAKSMMLGLGQALNQTYTTDPAAAGQQNGADLASTIPDPTAATLQTAGQSGQHVAGTAATGAANQPAVPGMVVGAHNATPAHLTGGTTAAVIHPAALRHDPALAASGSATVVPPLHGGAASQPTLAGTGASTLAPAPAPAPMGGLAGAPAPAAGGGFSGIGTAGAVPSGMGAAGFGAVAGGAVAGGAVGGGPAGRGTAVRSAGPAAAEAFPPVAGGSGAASERDDERRRRSGAVVSPAAGGAGAKRSEAVIRPGTAKIPVRAGVSAALRGRAGDPGVGGTVRRRPGSRREKPETVQFLDEDAWLTDGDGVGLVDAPAER